MRIANMISGVGTIWNNLIIDRNVMTRTILADDGAYGLETKRLTEAVVNHRELMFPCF